MILLVTNPTVLFHPSCSCAHVYRETPTRCVNTSMHVSPNETSISRQRAESHLFDTQEAVFGVCDAMWGSHRCFSSGSTCNHLHAARFSRMRPTEPGARLDAPGLTQCAVFIRKTAVGAFQYVPVSVISYAAYAIKNTACSITAAFCLITIPVGSLLFLVL